MYAFFRNIRLPSSATAGDFLACLVAAIETRAAPDRTSKVGPLHNVTLESRSALSPKKIDQLSTLLQTAAFRAFLGKVVGTASLLQSPVYVGKAASLQARIRQHLDPMSPLAVRLRGADTTINACTLAYALVDESPVALDAQSLFLIEDIITRLCRPGFVSRIG